MSNKKHPELHYTFWRVMKHKREHRYYVLFDTWKNIRTSLSITGYDTLEEALEECKLINITYSSTPKPEKVFNDNGMYYVNGYWGKRYDYDYSNGAYFWGYALLDLEECKFLKVVNEFQWGGHSIKNKNDHETFDYYFRKEEEVPEEYEWDENEYDGWIQFRWGDGKNAIGYIEKEEKKKKKSYKPKDKYFRKLDEEELNEIAYINEGQSYESEALENKLEKEIDALKKKELEEKFW